MRVPFRCSRPDPSQGPYCDRRARKIEEGEVNGAAPALDRFSWMGSFPSIESVGLTEECAHDRWFKCSATTEPKDRVAHEDQDDGGGSRLEDPLVLPQR